MKENSSSLQTQLRSVLSRLEKRIPPEKRVEFMGHVCATLDAVAGEYIHIPEEKRVGEAYLAFRSDEERDIVFKGLNKLRKQVKVPEALELILYTQQKQVPDDANLRDCWEDIARHDPGDDLRYPYFLRARLQKATTREVYDHISNMLGVLLTKRKPFPVCSERQNYTDQRWIKVGRRYVVADLHFKN